MEVPHSCVVLDLGNSIVLTLLRAAGRKRHCIRAPISHTLRVLRSMGWQVVETRHDAMGQLRVYLDRIEMDDMEQKTISHRRIRIGTPGRLC